MFKFQTKTGPDFRILGRFHAYSEGSDTMARNVYSTPEKAQPSGQDQPRIMLSQARQIIRDAWPSLFPDNRFRPVKLGISHDMIQSDAAARLHLKPADIKRIMWLVSQTFNYRKSVAQPGSFRWDLNGQPVEPVSEEHRLHALKEIRAVGRLRAQKLRSVTGKYALFLTRPSVGHEVSWANESDEADNISLVVYHSSKWAAPARLSFDFSRQLPRFPPEQRETLCGMMWDAVQNVSRAAWLYHGVTVKLTAETPYRGLFSGLDEPSVHTTIERLYREFHRVFQLRDPYQLYRETGIKMPAIGWRKHLNLNEEK